MASIDNIIHIVNDQETWQFWCRMRQSKCQFDTKLLTWATTLSNMLWFLFGFLFWLDAQQDLSLNYHCPHKSYTVLNLKLIPMISWLSAHSAWLMIHGPHSEKSAEMLPLIIAYDSRTQGMTLMVPLNLSTL